jgi:hypothetical protein
VSTFRCRLCDLKVTDPIEHIEVAHRVPLTMAQVWSQFALVSSSHGRGRSEKDTDEVKTEPLF